MFDFLRRKKKKQEDSNEQEYTFIWYKKMENKDKVFYTQPFRTKVRAKDKNEAVEKVTQFALSKMKLVIVEEDKYTKSDLSNLQKSFDDLYKQMDDLMGKFKK